MYKRGLNKKTGLRASLVVQMLAEGALEGVFRVRLYTKTCIRITLNVQTRAVHGSAGTSPQWPPGAAKTYRVVISDDSKFSRFQTSRSIHRGRVQAVPPPAFLSHNPPPSLTIHLPLSQSASRQTFFKKSEKKFGDMIFVRTFAVY